MITDMRELAVRHDWFPFKKKKKRKLKNKLTDVIKLFGAPDLSEAGLQC